MSLREEDRETLIRLELEKARHLLQQADMMCELSQWDMAANRFYYACFHAVQALFVRNGLSSRRHSGMISQFGLHFIKTGVIEDRLGAFLNRMERLREKGDYNCLYTVDEDELRSFISPAHELIETIEALLGKDENNL